MYPPAGRAETRGTIPRAGVGLEIEWKKTTVLTECYSCASCASTEQLCYYHGYINTYMYFLSNSVASSQEDGGLISVCILSAPL